MSREPLLQTERGEKGQERREGEKEGGRGEREREECLGGQGGDNGKWREWGGKEMDRRCKVGERKNWREKKEE